MKSMATLECDNMKTEKITVLENEPMAKHTSWRAGGVAKRFVKAESVDALADFIATLPKQEKILWIGLGSNTLVRDGGFDGTVIATQNVMTQLQLLDSTTVYVGAGLADAKLAKFCHKQGLTGAEFFAGIPGLVGGALAMNAGAWGGETWPLVTAVETLNRNGEIKQRSADEFEYGYRHLSGLNGEWFVSATFALKQKTASENTVDIKQLLAQRSASQPTGVASCGSVFQNPENAYAAELIEQTGLKGKRIGGAVISEKHANFIINDNAASAEDIESLIELVQQTVQQQHNITLQTEVRIVGDRSRGEV